VLTVGLAGLVVGTVLGYQIGLRDRSIATRPIAGEPPVTEVVVPSDDVPTDGDEVSSDDVGATEPGDTEVPSPAAADAAGSPAADEAPRAVASTSGAGAGTGTGAGPAPTRPAATPRGRSTRAAAEPRGRLDVRSFPPGALLTLNGQVHGRTPLSVRDLELGTYAVQIARPGYVPQSMRVTLSEEHPSSTVTVELQEGPLVAATTGSVFISSNPRGAQVFLDGVLIGTTPLQVPGVAAGAHRVRLVLAGHLPLDLPVNVRPGQVERISGALAEAEGGAGASAAGGRSITMGGR
jgi:hypothetical protein